MINLRENGSAALEAIAVSTLIIFLVLALFSSAYFIFARAWLDYESEMALLCLATGRNDCARRFEQRVDRFLPWGKLAGVETQHAQGAWRIKGKWHFNGVTLKVHQTLNLERAAKNGALHW